MVTFMKIKTAKQTAQQGDILLRKVNQMPDGEQRKLSQKRCVLADGEHTGHQHVCEDEEAELIAIGEKMILTLEKAATVVHPEHGPIRLAPGIWEVGRVREFDWLSRMERQVID